jgi:hypothetical protein
MFRETVTAGDGASHTGACSEVHALSLLYTAVRRGYSVEATRDGGAVIVRILPGGARRTVTLEPAAPAGTVTRTMRSDLNLITLRGGSGRASLAGGCILAPFYRCPPAATARLVARGLVTVTDTGGVTVSLSARLAMLAQDHRTTTSQPRGYHRPADYGEPSTCGIRRHDRGSVASCSCGSWSLPAEDRDTARRKGHEHRQQVTSAMLRTLF